MIPGDFQYHRPASVDEAVALLGQHGEEAKVLAGGQSLIAMMKLRLAAPEHLIDINRIEGLSGIAEQDGVLRIGAVVTQNELIASALIGEKCPLIAEAAEQIADPQGRNCG
ncbi:MAG: FAD binding domain-containing protein, partial [Alphaproteobacteria bacterium]|nr:FAD binding domain-containing protein [Alphaproteobacteria bacterium]